ncbi:hypothetical protein FRC02_000449 [Tulasnella sp. 418]|nr:hypothetical protein FRC02_000449 [Tulasnella sp. 418]
MQFSVVTRPQAAQEMSTPEPRTSHKVSQTCGRPNNARPRAKSKRLRTRATHKKSVKGNDIWDKLKAVMRREKKLAKTTESFLKRNLTQLEWKELEAMYDAAQDNLQDLIQDFKDSLTLGNDDAEPRSQI